MQCLGLSLSILVATLARILLDRLLAQLSVNLFTRVDDLLRERALEWLKRTLSLVRARLLDSLFRQAGQV